jgi:hypothetical protein
VGGVNSGRPWAYLGAALGGGASVSANVAHSLIPADPDPGAVIAAGFWPIALLVAVEILVRVGWPEGRWYTVLRFAGLGLVALVAAVVSYRHLSGLLDHYNEDPLTVAIGPLALDGLLLMSAAALLATRPVESATTALDASVGLAPRLEAPAPAPTPSTPDTGGAPERVEQPPPVATRPKRPSRPVAKRRPDVATVADMSVADQVAWVANELASGADDRSLAEWQRITGWKPRTVDRRLASAKQLASGEPEPADGEVANLATGEVSGETPDGVTGDTEDTDRKANLA